MKKIITFAIAAIMALSLIALPVSAADDLEIDFGSLTADTNMQIYVFEAAGYTENVIQFMQQASAQNLGSIDLSKYGSVTIHYGSDGNAIFQGDKYNGFLAITENGPVMDTAGEPLADAKIVGKVELEDQSNGGWAQGDTEVTIPLDSTYNGPVYVALFSVTKAGVSPNGNFDAVAITSITFNAKTSDGGNTPTDPTAKPTEKPTNKPVTPSTGDSSPIFMVAAAGIVLTVVTIVIKKKSEN